MADVMNLRRPLRADHHGTGREITVVFAIAERVETVEVVTAY
jgi:hypothetical protein